MQSNSKRERNYGIDLLRIVSMFMVLMLHMLGQGGVLSGVKAFTFKGEFFWFLENACFCAVNVYAIISGFVGYKAKPRLKKLLSLWLQVLLYSVMLGIPSDLYRYFASGVTINIKNIIKCFLPVFFNKYWYFSGYVVLFIFMPLLNIAIEKVSKEILRNGLIFIIIIYAYAPNSAFGGNDGYSAIWLIILYLLGGYIAKYNPFKKLKSWMLFLLYFISISINYASRWPAKLMGLSPQVIMTYTSIFIVLAAVFLVLGFSRMELGKGSAKIVAFLSPMTFGVYIIHLSRFVWEDLLAGIFVPITDKNLLVVFVFVSAAAVLLYIICSVIDFCRMQIFRLLHVEDIFGWMVKTVKKITDKIFRSESVQDKE